MTHDLDELRRQHHAAVARDHWSAFAAGVGVGCMLTLAVGLTLFLLL